MASKTVLLESLDLIREHHFNNAQKGEILFPGNPGGVSAWHNKVVFDKFEYHPPVAGLNQLPSTDPILKKLSYDIQYASHESGSPLILNGFNGVCCHMGRKEDGRSKSKKTNTHIALVK
eukprot:3855797-Ditylum_brightwellii.AAC.1